MSIRKRILPEDRLPFDNIIGMYSEVLAKLPPNKMISVEVVYAPMRNNISMKASKFPKEFHDVPRTNIVCGLVYCCGLGIGPGKGVIAWVCTDLYFEEFVGKDRIGRETPCKPEVTRPQFKYLSRHSVSDKRSLLDAREDAYEAIYDAYEDLFSVRLFHSL